MKVKGESEVAQSCPTLATPWTAAYQAPPSMGFSRQEYWSGVPLPSLHGAEAHPQIAWGFCPPLGSALCPEGPERGEGKHRVPSLSQEEGCQSLEKEGFHL